jgi:hypothetical protein
MRINNTNLPAFLTKPESARGPAQIWHRKQSGCQLLFRALITLPTMNSPIIYNKAHILSSSYSIIKNSYILVIFQYKSLYIFSNNKIKQLFRFSWNWKQLDFVTRIKPEQLAPSSVGGYIFVTSSTLNGLFHFKSRAIPLYKVSRLKVHKA